jgi:hypothetical protein
VFGCYSAAGNVCIPSDLSIGISNLLQPAQAEVVLGQFSAYLKELSHEIEMGCLWYGLKAPYLEMNL